MAKRAQPSTLKAPPAHNPPAEVDARSRTAPANLRGGQGQPLPPAPRPAASGRIKVMATKVCYYDNKRRRVGDVFSISGELNAKGEPKEFSKLYMQKVDPHTPERITTGAEILQQQHDEILAGKAVERNPDLSPPRTASAIDEDDEG